MPARFIDGIALAAALIAVVMLVDRTRSERRISPMLDEYASVADHITEGSTIWTEYPSDRDATPDGWKIAKHVRPFVHANGLLVTARNVVDLTNYEAATDYFPLIFRDKHIVPSPFREGGVRANYILIWQTTPSSDSPAAEMVRRRIASDYIEVFRSANGFATLYRVRDSVTSNSQEP
jgi:hypothetical protein